MNEPKDTLTHSKQKEDLPNEKWCDFYDGGYAISSYGRVYSYKSSRLLTVYKDRFQNTIRVSSDGKAENLSVARLVASAFIRDPKEGEEVMHINKNKWDDRVGNLKVVSHHESKVRNFEVGVYENPEAKMKELRKQLEESGNNRFVNGADHINAKLDSEKVKEIRIRYNKEDITQYDLADEYNVSRGCIDGILRKQTWKHV